MYVSNEGSEDIFLFSCLASEQTVCYGLYLMIWAGDSSWEPLYHRP